MRKKAISMEGGKKNEGVAEGGGCCWDYVSIPQVLYGTVRIEIVDSSKIIRAIVIGFFFICALYTALERKMLSPLIGFGIFILLSYAMVHFFKKEKAAMKEGKVLLWSTSTKMLLLFLGAVIFIAASFIYTQGIAIDGESKDIILRYMAFFVVLGFFLFKATGLDRPEYMYTINVQGLIRLIIVIIILIPIYILSYEALAWLF